MKAIVTFILVCVIVLPANAASLATMETFGPVRVEEATGKPVAAEQVKRAILTAAQTRGWKAHEQSAGRIVATILVRGRFRVTVEIPYSARELSVNYLSSENLDYRPTEKGAEIHRNYNKWVATLVNDIKAQLILI